ncbi:MAG TPA: hypothetical protein VGI78_19635 [Acetobacteraceae bacterium]|jgi:hypothetical protein
MDMQTPDHATLPTPGDPAAQLSAVFTRYIRHALADTVPIGPDDSQETRDQKRQAAQELFDALHAVDPAEAQLAAITVAASLAAMDSFARAARPGTSDATAARMRASGLAAGHAYAAWLRDLRERQPAAEQARPAAAPASPARPPPTEPERDPPEVPPGFIALRPGAKPIPEVVTFQPRDRFGEPIPDLRTDLMTRAQLRASLAIPRDPDLEAEALAEEAAMIAEQAALDAKARGGS